MKKTKSINPFSSKKKAQVKARPFRKTFALPEQPYDELLLAQSDLYRRSRQLYLQQEGRFQATLLSSARSLGSVSLLENLIEYTPIASELDWSLRDRLQKKDHAHIAMVRSFTTGVFHEQNHRILWRHFSDQKIDCPQRALEACRFLNCAESLVIILDMALADELNSKLAKHLYSVRGIYQSGAEFMRLLKVGSRSYRNALQVCFYTTYLRLEGLHPDDIPGYVKKVFEGLDQKLVERCIERAMRIDSMFVELTSPFWQKKHVGKVMEVFAPPRGKLGLVLPARQPLRHVETYVIVERWLEAMGL